MSTYIGFSTQRYSLTPFTLKPGSDGGVSSPAPAATSKKFKLVDEQLVIQDLINALNIPQGSKTGKPSYGTTLWSFVFEPNTQDIQYELETEIRRVVSGDPRLILNSVTIYSKENGILIEVELAVAPFNNADTLRVFFDQQANSAYVV